MRPCQRSHRGGPIRRQIGVSFGDLEEFYVQKVADLEAKDGEDLCKHLGRGPSV